MFGKIEPTINYYPPGLPLQIIHFKKEDYENEIASTKQSNTKQSNKLFQHLCEHGSSNITCEKKETQRTLWRFKLMTHHQLWRSGFKCFLKPLWLQKHFFFDDGWSLF